MREQDNEYDDEPELAGYQARGDKPLRSPHLVTVMRVVVVIGLVGLILPGILITAATANRTALTTCAIYTAYFAPEAINYSARFELASPAGFGWNCYAIAFGGSELLVKALGPIPGGPVLPQVPKGSISSRGPDKSVQFDQPNDVGHGPLYLAVASENEQ